MCKRLIRDNAPDTDIAEYLNIRKRRILRELSNLIFSKISKSKIIHYTNTYYSLLAESKIDYFKYKMEIFEDGIRNRR